MAARGKSDKKQKSASTAKKAAKKTEQAKVRAAKVGMIFECGPAGADVQVCQVLTRLICPELDVSPVTLDNKKKLVQGCGVAAKLLLADGCARVIIIWDLYPAWREHGQKPDCIQDRADIESSLAQAGVERRLIDLVCIREELEAWLLADHRALSTVLSTATRPAAVSARKNLEQIVNPKKVMTKLFKEKRGCIYSDLQHAVRIARAMPDLSQIGKVQSFAHFRKKVIALCPTAERSP